MRSAGSWIRQLAVSTRASVADFIGSLAISHRNAVVVFTFHRPPSSMSSMRDGEAMFFVCFVFSPPVPTCIFLAHGVA